MPAEGHTHTARLSPRPRSPGLRTPQKTPGPEVFEPPSVRPREIGNGTCVGLPVSVETSWTEGAILNPTWTYFSL